ncbi:MAG: hypothetical protein AAFU70_11955, partial [Planctomycetota bacterium]
MRVVLAARLPDGPDVAEELQAVRDTIARIGVLIADACRWFAAQAGGLGGTLVDIAEGLLEALEEVGREIAAGTAAAGDILAVELRLDGRTLRPRQVLVTPLSAGGGDYRADVGGFTLAVSRELTPSLIYDFHDGWVGIAVRGTGTAAALLETDLWMTPGSGPATPLRELPLGGQQPDGRLFRLEAIPKPNTEVLLVALRDGQLLGFQAFGAKTATEIQIDGEKIASAAAIGSLRRASIGLDHKQDVKLRVDYRGLKDKVLSLIPKAKEEADPKTGILEDLSQRVKISFGDDPVAKVDDKERKLTIPVEISVIVTDELKPRADLELLVDL